jgi:hypothetical protein
MRAVVIADRVERRVKTAVQTALRARTAPIPPLREAMRDRSLLDAARESTGVDLAAAAEQVLAESGATAREAGAWLAARLTETMESLAAAGARGWARPAPMKTSTSLHAIRRPFGCAAAPDGRLAVTDWDGARVGHDRSAYLVEPANGQVSEFARGPGLQLGSFGPDGAYYAQLYGEAGVFRLTAHDRQKVLSTAEEEVILQTIALASGELLLLDWSRDALRLHAADGSFAAELLASGRFSAMRGLTAHGDDYWFIADGAIYTGNVRQPGRIALFAKAPFGVFDHLTATSGGLAATVGYRFRLTDGGERTTLWGLCGLDWSGDAAFISPRNPFAAMPIMLCGCGANRLAALDVGGRCLLTFDWP